MSKVLQRVGGGGGSGEGASILVTGIPQTGNVVTATKGSKTVNGVWGATIQNPEWRGLPSGYTQVKSLIGDGNAYIDTTYLPNDNTIYDITLKSPSTSSDKNPIGSRANSYYDLTVWENTSSGKGYAFHIPRSGGYEEQVDTGWIYTSDVVNTIRNIRVGSRYGVTVDGISIYNPVYESSWTSTVTTLLFAYHDTTSVTVKGIGAFQIFDCIIYEGDTKCMDFVPCKNSSNEYGMYDMVTGTFFGNSGTGSFTGGEEVPQFISAEGYLISPLTEYGEWTVTATDGTHSASQTVTVDMLMMYEIEMGYKIDTDFSSQGNWREVGGTFAYTSGGIQFAVGSETGTQTFMSGFNGQYIEHDINLEEWDMTLTNNVYGTNAQYGGIAVQLVDSSNNPIVSIYRGDGYGGTSNYNYFKLFDSSFSQLQYTQVSGINNVSLTMSMTYHSGTLVAKYNSTQIYSASHTLNDVAKVRVWFIHETGYSNPLEVASHLIVE